MTQSDVTYTARRVTPPDMQPRFEVEATHGPSGIRVRRQAATFKQAQDECRDAMSERCKKLGFTVEPAKKSGVRREKRKRGALSD